MTINVVYRVLAGHVNPLWAVLGFAIGVGIGLVLARTKKLAWDETERLVIGTSDALGIAILVAYLVFIIFLRESVIGHWVHDPHAVGVIGLSMTAGAMLSRVHFTARGVRRILILAGIMHEPVT